MQLTRIYTLCLLQAGLLFTGLAQKPFEYEISGNIKGLGNDTLLMFTHFNNDPAIKLKMDTLLIVARDDHFYFKGRSEQPGLVYAQAGTKRGAGGNFSFFLEKGHIQIAGSRDSLDHVVVTGAPHNNDYAYGLKRMNDYYDRIRVMGASIRARTDQKDAESQRLMGKIGGLYDSIITFQVQFIKDHPGSMASGMFLYLVTDKIPVYELESIYNGLDTQVQHFSPLSRLPARIAAKKRSVIGKQAQDFTMQDIKGTNVHLEDFKGKFVLLDFWASWCAPCRAESPALVKAYRQFKDKGLVIISVSADTDAKKWKDAVKNDGLDWVHVSDLSGSLNPVSKMYGVQPIPDNFLIDPNGKIIARGLFGGELKRKLDELIK